MMHVLCVDKTIANNHFASFLSIGFHTKFMVTVSSVHNQKALCLFKIFNKQSFLNSNVLIEFVYFY